MLSRVLGYARDAIIFIIFGAGGATDAFLVAFRLPNLMRRLFGEGALSQAFVPVFQEYKKHSSDAELHRFADCAAGTLGVILLVITAIGIVAAPLLITIFAPGFIDESDRFDLSAQMLRITFPYLLFISLTALAVGILNSYGHFGAPAFTPVLMNLSLIIATLWAAPKMDEPITALAWGVLIAGIAQLSFIVLWLRRIGWSFRLRLDFYHRGVRRVGKLMLPAVFSSAIVQVNLLFDTLIASFLVAGSISWLYISDRFVELPMGVFGIAISTVLLARLSEHRTATDIDSFKRTMDWGIRAALMLALPCVVGLVVLAKPILVSLIQYRQFTADDTLMVSISLMAYAIGLPMFMLIKIFSCAFFAHQNTKLPMRIAVVAMLSNIALNIVFVLLWQYIGWVAPHAALALATSVSALLNSFLLYRALRHHGIFRIETETKTFAKKILIASLMMGLLLVLVMRMLPDWNTWSAPYRVSTLAGLVVSGAIVYFISLLLLRIKLRENLHWDTK
ncbi:MAG: murein biosynthesis integral membrane protein MurJ [Chromatiales bacterium]|nr:murein biosynthesis integral membrane protein MurJ [Chromatiales bacterium]